ncbi:MAG: hypothetical protein JNG84_13395, partial [Archangium sp.]|nr:hypothetical protein [Archangium sp.]
MKRVAPQPFFDELVSWVTAQVPSEELASAKAEWFQRTGEVFDDDRQLEARMGAFL